MGLHVWIPRWDDELMNLLVGPPSIDMSAQQGVLRDDLSKHPAGRSHFVNSPDMPRHCSWRNAVVIASFSTCDSTCKTSKSERAGWPLTPCRLLCSTVRTGSVGLRIPTKILTEFQFIQYNPKLGTCFIIFGQIKEHLHPQHWVWAPPTPTLIHIMVMIPTQSGSNMDLHHLCFSPKSGNGNRKKNIKQVCNRNPFQFIHDDNPQWILEYNGIYWIRWPLPSLLNHGPTIIYQLYSHMFDCKNMVKRFKTPNL